MRVTVGREGCIVIPKELCDALGIGPGSEVRVVVDGTGLRLEPVRPPERPDGERDGLPVLGHVTEAIVTDDDVRNLRDELGR